jgi:murein tripeptide amidase MpaA
VRSIGDSVEGRAIYIAKISDNVADDVEPGEPEVLFDALHHAREHLTPEMALFILHLLVDRYGGKGALGWQVTQLVDSRVVWIVFMLNPDGLVYDLTAGGPYGPGGNAWYAGWRKNRQDNPGSPADPRWASTSTATTATDGAAAAGHRAARSRSTTAATARGWHRRSGTCATS